MVNLGLHEFQFLKLTLNSPVQTDVRLGSWPGPVQNANPPQGAWGHHPAWDMGSSLGAGAIAPWALSLCSRVGAWGQWKSTCPGHRSALQPPTHPEQENKPLRTAFGPIHSSPLRHQGSTLKHRGHRGLGSSDRLGPPFLLSWEGGAALTSGERTKRMESRGQKGGKGQTAALGPRKDTEAKNSTRRFSLCQHLEDKGLSGPRSQSREGAGSRLKCSDPGLVLGAQ